MNTTADERSSEEEFNSPSLWCPSSSVKMLVFMFQMNWCARSWDVWAAHKMYSLTYPIYTHTHLDLVVHITRVIRRKWTKTNNPIFPIKYVLLWQWCVYYNEYVRPWPLYTLKIWRVFSHKCAVSLQKTFINTLQSSGLL